VAVVVSAAIFVGYRRHRRGRHHHKAAPTPTTTTTKTTAAVDAAMPPATTTTTPASTTTPLPSCDSVHAAQSPWKLTAPDALDSEDCACCESPRQSQTGIKVTRRLSISIPDTDSDAIAAAVQRRKLSISIPDHDSDAETHSLPSPTSSLDDHHHDDHWDHGLPLAKVPSMKEQSPIDIHEDESEIVPMASCPNAVTISMSEGTGDLVQNDHGFSVVWSAPGKNTLTIGGKVYTAVQFHFHTPSEHTLDGVHEELELHMVHMAADGTLAVLGVLFREGKTNKFLGQFWDKLTEIHPGQSAKIPVGTIDTQELDILSGSFFRYRGSLTTPPYTEGVEWVVIHDVMEASREQLDIFHSALPGTNARDLQPLNDRHVWLAC
jgi:carbonic anhydrase